MKYLITGGTGFLGRYIVDSLQQKENEIFITTRHPDKPNHIFADFEKCSLNLESLATLNAGVDELIVIHAAGKAHSVPKTEIEKKAFFAVNVEGTKLLLEQLEKLCHLPQRFVFISSVSVYGRDAGININEDSSLDATDPYGISKIEAEQLILKWGAEHKVVISIVRLPLVAGKNPPGNLRSMINGIKSGRYFRIGNGSARKSMVWAADVASILPSLAQKGGVYNLTDGYHPDFAELENEITASMHVKPVKKMPFLLAYIAGIAGSILENITNRKMPINIGMVQKITSPLTFSDQKARSEIGWNPSGVLEHINEMLS
jgi:nucleoside-diphosphate-sugar epimerase